MSDVTTKWQKSSFCADHSCVEVARIDDYIAVRDGKDRRGRPLMFDNEAWSGFVAAVSAGEFENL